MTNLERLTNKICALIPEIKELKFGCKVKCENHIYKVIHEFDHHDSNYIRLELNRSLYFFDIDFFNKKFIIIGRDITICDVLRALKITYSHNKVCYDEWRMFPFKENTNEFIFAGTIKDGEYAWRSFYECWNLENNALHLQSESFINWLCEIMGIK